MCGIEVDLDATNRNSRKIGSTSWWLKGETMKDEYQRRSSIRLASRDGVDFWNRMIASLNRKIHSTLSDQLTGYMRKKFSTDEHISCGQNFTFGISVVPTG